MPSPALLAFNLFSALVSHVPPECSVTTEQCHRHTTIVTSRSEHEVRARCFQTSLC